MVHVLLEEPSHVLLLELFSHVRPKVKHSERIPEVTTMAAATAPARQHHRRGDQSRRSSSPFSSYA